MKSQVLVVDDNAAYHALLGAAAQARGFQMLPAVTEAARAIAVCQQQHPEIVILDLHLKGDVDGLALCELIGEIDGSIQIVAASGFDETGMVDQAFRRGAHRCLRKPFRHDEALRLFEHLARELDRAPA